MAGAAAVFATSFRSDDAAKRAAELVAAAETKAPDLPDVVAADFLVLVVRGALTKHSRCITIS